MPMHARPITGTKTAEEIEAAKKVSFDTETGLVAYVDDEGTWYSQSRTLVDRLHKMFRLNPMVVTYYPLRRPPPAVAQIGRVAVRPAHIGMHARQGRSQASGNRTAPPHACSGAARHRRAQQPAPRHLRVDAQIAGPQVPFVAPPGLRRLGETPADHPAPTGSSAACRRAARLHSRRRRRTPAARPYPPALGPSRWRKGIISESANGAGSRKRPNLLSFSTRCYPKLQPNGTTIQPFPDQAREYRVGCRPDPGRL